MRKENERTDGGTYERAVGQMRLRASAYVVAAADVGALTPSNGTHPKCARR